MVLKELVARMRERKQRFNTMKEQDRMETTIATRKMNSNEREVMRFREEARQKQINDELEEFRKQRRTEEQQQTILGGPNLFSGGATVLQDNKDLFGMKMTNVHGGLFFK